MHCMNQHVVASSWFRLSGCHDGGYDYMARHWIFYLVSYQNYTPLVTLYKSTHIDGIALLFPSCGYITSLGLLYVHCHKQWQFHKYVLRGSILAAASGTFQACECPDKVSHSLSVVLASALKGQEQIPFLPSFPLFSNDVLIITNQALMQE